MIQTYIYENRNPDKKRVGDCVIRAISKVMDMSWDDVAIDLSMMMVAEKDIVSSVGGSGGDSMWS